MTQSQRVLNRLLSHGSVNPVDFQAPACDGGKPILRVAARIGELKDRGYGIETRIEKNRTCTYTLTEVEQALEGPSRVDSSDQSSGESGKIAAASTPAESLFSTAGNGYEVAA